jgi:hypothetical protein
VQESRFGFILLAASAFLHSGFYESDVGLKCREELLNKIIDQLFHRKPIRVLQPTFLPDRLIFLVIAKANFGGFPI